MILSILVPCLKEREPQPVLAALRQQADGKSVEILTLTDNRELSVGAKRNRLLDLATGTHLAFVDDDDEVAPDYIDSILAGLADRPTTDILCFYQLCLLVETGVKRWCSYSLGFEYEQGVVMDPGVMIPTGDEWWRGKPAHTMVWRAAIAKSCRFPEKNFGEDVDWVAQACGLARTECHIHKVLYTYKFDSRRSATRG